MPVASFTATPPKGEFPLAVSFDAGASSDSDGTIVDYAWTFGDGTSASGVTAEHTYTAIGTYTATLFVTDDDGSIGSTTRTVKVTRVTTSISPESGAAGSTIDASVPCAPLDGWVAGAAAMASLVDSNSNVLDTVTFENTDINQARVALTLTVPADAAAGTYSVTSSCDTYLGSDVFDPVDFTVN
ncbi:MAG: PKD domain-containing protein [Microthrixaceae bacterium]